MRVPSLLVAALVAAPVAIARADTVKLRDGTVIENVKAKREGDRIVVSRQLGSTSFPVDDVLEVIGDPHWQDRDELVRRKRDAGDDPAALRRVAEWCNEHGLEKDARDQKELARFIELDRRLDALFATKDAKARAKGYLDLSEQMKHEGYSGAEQKAVRDKALEAAPDDAEIRRAFGQVQRTGDWVSLEEARRIDAEAEEQAMLAKGLVQFEGRWVTPAQVDAIEARRAAEAEARAAEAAARAEREACAARERAEYAARVAAAEAARRRRCDAGWDSSSGGFIGVMPAYPPVRNHHQLWRRHSWRR